MLPLVLLIKGSPGDKRWPTKHYAQHNTVHDSTTGVLSALLPMSSLVLLSCLRHCSHAGYAIILVLFLLGQLVAVPGTSWGRPSTLWCWMPGAGRGVVLVEDCSEEPARGARWRQPAGTGETEDASVQPSLACSGCVEARSWTPRASRGEDALDDRGEDSPVRRGRKLGPPEI